MCAVCCFLVPGSFGGGPLVGPWCALYLLLDSRDGAVREEPVSPGPGPPLRHRLRRFVPAIAPLAATALSAAVSLCHVWNRAVHASHYQGKTMFEAFHPGLGLVNTVRTLADNQVIGAFGIHRADAFPLTTAAAIVAIVAALAVLWWRIARPVACWRSGWPSCSPATFSSTAHGRSSC